MWAKSDMTAKMKSGKKRKFEKLVTRASSTGSQHQPPNDKSVVNLSSQLLTSPERRVLSRSLNFAIAARKIPLKEILAAVEDGLRRANSDQAQLARTNVVGIFNRTRASLLNLPH